MADQELTDLQVLTILAGGDLFFVRDVSTNIDKQITASTIFNFLSTKSIDDLSDVDTTTSPPGVGDQLEWDGTNWVPGLGSIGLHAATHVSGGSDEIDGDILDIDFTPTSYAPLPAVPPWTTAPVELTSHLAGIDTALSGKAPAVHTHVEADITDLQAYLLDITGEILDDLQNVASAGAVAGELLVANGTGGWIHQTIAAAGIAPAVHTHVEADITDLQAYLLAEVNDLTSAVVWANVPDANITQSSVTQHEAAIDHDALLNFVADEHVAHSTITLTAGVALVGGGDISASRTFDVDINSLTPDAAPDGSADYVMTYDASVPGHKKVLLDNLPGAGAGSPQDPTTVVQGRRTTTVSPGGSWTAVSFDVTDVENNSSVLDHAGTRITIKETGPVLVYYASVVDGTATSVTEARVLLNGSTVIPGSYQKFAALTVGSAGDLDNVFTFIATANDYIELEVQDAGASPATLAVNAFFGTVKLSGVKGLDWTGPWQDTTSYQVDDAVENGGVAYICIQDHTSATANEPDTGGSWTTYWQVLAKAGPDLGDLDDVTITSVAVNDLIQWNGSAWVNRNLAAAGIAAASHTHVEADITDLQAYLLNINSESIDDLSDVDTTSSAPSVNDVLAWDGANWIPSATAAPSAHTHVEADITDLQNYSLVGHTHTESDITDLQNYALAVHTHVEADITDLQAYLLNINSESIDDLSDVNTSGVASGDILQWNGASWVPVASDTPGLHAATHVSGGSDEIDGDVLDIDWVPTNYTRLTSPTEVTAVVELTAHLAGIDAELATFAPAVHTHVEADITDLQNYALAVHTHVEADITDLQAYLLNITAEPLSDLVDVTITSIASGEILKWTGSAWINNTLAEAGIAPASHTHVEADITDLQNYSLVGHTHTESDITDLQAYVLPTDSIDILADVDTTTSSPSVTDVLAWNGSNWVPTAAGAGASTFVALTDTPADYTGGVGNYFVKVNGGATGLVFVADPGYLTAEVNDLSAAVTWVNVPDANITQSSVTQHEAALSITESQISDLQAYLLDITGELLNDLSDVVLTTPVSGEYLCYNGANWVNDAIDLDDLNDVTLTAIGAGELIVWNGSLWVNNTLAEAGIAAASHTHVEADITDLQAYLLNINSESIDDLSDVVITTPSGGDYLRYNGANWVNAVITESDISDLAHAITLEDEGTPVANTPHATLNFVGSGVTVTDAGSGEATVTITSGGGTTPKYDCQEVTRTTTASTDSTSWIDLGGMTLTTKDLSENGTYKLTFSCYANCEKSNRTYRFRFVVDGTPLGEEWLNSSGTGSGATDEMNVSMTQTISGVAISKIIKVQFLIDDPSGANAVNVFDRSLVIFGVPSTQVVS